MNSAVATASQGRSWIGDGRGLVRFFPRIRGITKCQMTHEPDWSLATWEGLRSARHREFQALSFRDKLQVIENLGEVTEYFALRAKKRAAMVQERKQSYGEPSADV